MGYKVCIYIVSHLCTAMCGMELTSQISLKGFPNEVKETIASFAVDTRDFRCPVSPRLKPSVSLILPYTLCPLIVESSELGESSVPSVQFRAKYNKRERAFELTLTTGTATTITDQFSCRFAGAYPISFFDGINEHGKALFALTDTSHALFMFTRSKEKNSNIVQRQKKLTPFCEGQGRIYSIMLHPTCNKIMYTVSQNNRGSENPCSVLLMDMDAQDKKATALTTDLKFLIKKTVDLGCDTYLGLAGEGGLTVIWEGKNQLEYAVQKHQTKFKDIAVDNSRKTEKGFKPYVACLAESGELFVAHMLAFEKPTLFLTQVIPNVTSAFRLFYDHGVCKVAYMEGGQYGNFLMWPDNMAIHYLRKAMGFSRPDKIIHS
jgi:hypothetical protein